jgi:hypothetical protein
MSDLTPLLREAADALWLIPIHAGLAQRLTNAAERTRPSEAEVIAKVTEAFVVELRAEWADAGCKTPMQVDGGCDCPDCVLANTVCAALDLVIQHRATPPLAPEVTAEKVALIEALRDAMKVGVPEGSNATEAIRWLTAALSTPPLPSAPERDCTCLGSCKGAQGLAAGWRCALSKGAPPLPSAEPVRDDDCGDGMTWADVREKVARALADAKKYELRVAFLRRTFAPLPSAEPKYAWVIVDSRYPAPDLRYYNGVGSNELGKGWTPNHMKAIRFCRNVDADAALMSLPHGWHLVGAVEQHGWSASTTPPAAAQDTGRLDWLEENGGRISGPADDSPRFVIWGDTDAQDVQGETLREAIDNAMSAARAAGGE